MFSSIHTHGVRFATQTYLTDNKYLFYKIYVPSYNWVKIGNIMILTTKIGHRVLAMLVGSCSYQRLGHTITPFPPHSEIRDSPLLTYHWLSFGEGIVVTVKQRQEFRIRLQKRARRVAERKLEAFEEERQAKTVI